MTTQRRSFTGSGELTVVQPDSPVKAAVLVLHGGRARSFQPVPPNASSVLRMIPFARAIGRVGAPAGVAVARLRFQVRGWNGRQRSPVHDARWALDQIRREYGEIPVAVVGHSMGGRTSLAIADDPLIVSVTALAPWVESYDPPELVAGKRLLVMHGEFDGLTSPQASAEFVTAAKGIAETASYIKVRREKHPMVLRATVWHQLATAFTLSALDDLASLGIDPRASLVAHRWRNTNTRNKLAAVCELAVNGEDAAI